MLIILYLFTFWKVYALNKNHHKAQLSDYEKNVVGNKFFEFLRFKILLNLQLIFGPKSSLGGKRITRLIRFRAAVSAIGENWGKQNNYLIFRKISVINME